MKLKVIGTGSKGNAYLLENEQEALLIECGVSIKEIKKAIDFDISKIKGCIVTHEHNDHSKSLLDVLKCGIRTWVSDSINEKFKRIATTPHLPFLYESKHSFKVGNFKIMPFDVKHDVPCVGFLIEHPECGKTLFLTDTYYCKYVFPGLNNIIIEANYSKSIIDKKYGPESEMMFLRDRILKSHFSIDNCIDLLKANDLTQVNNIVLIHLSDTNSDENSFKSRVECFTGKNVTVARNGIDIDFKKTPF